MNNSYEEIIEGETILRFPPDSRHEGALERIHASLRACLASHPSLDMRDIRALSHLSPGTMLRPDLSLYEKADSKLWLIVEVIDSDDHRMDTVTKKNLYEDLNIPRLWMVDPRYNNVEVYRGTEYGLALQRILGGREVLSDDLLPGFSMAIAELFANI